MQKVDKKPVEVTQDRTAQALLNKFLSGEIGPLEPVYDIRTGYRYPAVEAIVGDLSKVEPFLNKLHEDRLLERKLADKVIYCPKCGSSRVSFRYCCPSCKSFNIQKSSLIEHVKCGYMDLEDNFRKGANLVCPKCGEELKKLNFDYRKAGIWCACRDCKKSFDVPVPEHYCLNCHTTSNFEQAIIKDVYSYTLGKGVKEQMSSNLFLIAPIRDFFLKEGLKVESPAFLKGKSGAKHSFDIAAYKADAVQKAIVVDLAISTETAVSEQPVIALFAKIFDVSPDKAFLVAIPKLSENAQKMAQLYNIQAIQARNQAEVVTLLKGKLQE